MTYKENITAILECYFSGFKKEIIDSACSRILEQKHQEIFDARYKQGYSEGTASHYDKRMTNEELIKNEKYHTCGRCKYDNTPEDKYPCNSCIHGTDHRPDLWELEQQSEYKTNEEDKE